MTPRPHAPEACSYTLLKKAGYDGVVVTGCAERPSYVWVNDDKAEIRDALSLWGKGSYGVRDRLRKTHGKRVRFVTTGVAGENRCRTATLMTDHEGSATGGFGAVLASKNLKAIAVVGSGRPALANTEKLAVLSSLARRLSERGLLRVPLPKEQMRYVGKASCHQCGLDCFRGLFRTASGKEAILTSVLDLSGRKRLLDIGGGPGTYAVHFCLQNPGLRATVFDLPPTRPFAEKLVRESGLSDRIDFAAGNCLEDPLPTGCDVAWLSQLLHAEGPEGCRQIIEKTVSCLEPGGLIVIHEFLLNDRLDGPLFPALFSLNMLVGTPTGQAYSEGQIRDMLTRAGIRQIRRLPFRGPNDSGLLAGTA